MKAWATKAMAGALAVLVFLLWLMKIRAERLEDERDRLRVKADSIQAGREADRATAKAQNKAREKARDHEQDKQDDRKSGRPVSGNAGDRLRDD